MAKKRVEARHESQCQTCAHPEREQIEQRYLTFATIRELAEEFGLPEWSLSRHIKYFRLDRQRSGNTSGVLRAIIACGVERVLEGEITAQVLLAAIKHLDVMEGRLQQSRLIQHDDKARRIAELKRTFETIRNETSITDEEIIKVMEKDWPDARQVLGLPTPEEA